MGGLEMVVDRWTGDPKALCEVFTGNLSRCFVVATVVGSTQNLALPVGQHLDCGTHVDFLWPLGLMLGDEVDIIVPGLQRVDKRAV